LSLRWLGPVAARLVTLVGITVATFLLLELAPGDPADLRLGRGSNVAAVAALRVELGLGDKAPVRYLHWLEHSLRFDFGHSFVDGRPVRVKLAEALPTTLWLGGLAALFGWGLGVPLGCALALARARHRRVAEVVLSLAYALPTASLALVLLRAGAPFGDRAPAIVTGALCLAVPLWVRIGRHQTAALGTALASDWARTARAIGASRSRVLVRHALRHALLPTVTLLTSELPVLLSGSLLIEQIFGLRGLGLLGIDAVLARDYPVLLGLGTLGAVLTFAGTALGDLLVRRLDPRLRTLEAT